MRFATRPKNINKSENTVEIALMLHSLWRWVVVGVALSEVVKFALGWLQKKSPEQLDRRIRSAFVGVIDVQFLLGIVLIAFYAINGVLLRPALEHAVIMVIAVVLAHASAAWNKREDNAWL